MAEFGVKRMGFCCPGGLWGLRSEEVELENGTTKLLRRQCRACVSWKPRCHESAAGPP